MVLLNRTWHLRTLGQHKDDVDEEDDDGDDDDDDDDDGDDDDDEMMSYILVKDACGFAQDSIW